MKKTYDRLLEAGLELFANQGVKVTTIRELEEKVGLVPGRGGFYRHFESKEALFKKILEVELYESSALIVTGSVQGKATTKEIESANLPNVLVRKLETVFEAFEKMFPVMRMLAHEYDAFPDVIDWIKFRSVDGMIAQWRVEIQSAVPSLSLSDEQINQRLVGVFSAIIGYFLMQKYFSGHIGGVEPTQLNRLLVQWLLAPEVSND